MPIYEYRCRKGHTFEVMQSFSDDHLVTCEVCGAAVERVYRPIAVHFKGSGFYNTDYGTRKRAREMKESKEGAKADGAKSDSAGSTDSGSSSSGSSEGSGSSGSDAGGSKSGAKKSDSSPAKAAKSQ